jgi:hypothetical protein
MHVIGLAWYRCEQWPLLRGLSLDGATFEPSHEAWLKNASSRLYDLEEQGHRVHKVDVDLTELLRWCEARGRQLDGQARADYVAELTGKAYPAANRTTGLS